MMVDIILFYWNEIWKKLNISLIYYYLNVGGIGHVLGKENLVWFGKERNKRF